MSDQRTLGPTGEARQAETGSPFGRASRDQIQRGPHSSAAIRIEQLAAVAIGLFSMVWLVVAIAELAVQRDLLVRTAGEDFFVLRDAAARWLSGGPFYHPTQLVGPYVWPGPWILYPPPVLVLLVPFVWLPAALWWIVPIGTVTAVAVRHRPRPLAVAAILFCLANPTVHSIIFWGNPTMWMVAALALGTLYAWPAALLFIKPSLLPFALFGANCRSWWLAVAGLGIVSLLFLPMWPDYLAVLTNARAAGSLLYSLPHVSAMLIPLAAWAGRRRTTERASHPRTPACGLDVEKPQASPKCNT